MCGRARRQKQSKLKEHVFQSFRMKLAFLFRLIKHNKKLFVAIGFLITQTDSFSLLIKTLCVTQKDSFVWNTFSVAEFWCIPFKRKNVNLYFLLIFGYGLLDSICILLLCNQIINTFIHWIYLFFCLNVISFGDAEVFVFHVSSTDSSYLVCIQKKINFYQRSLIWMWSQP